MCDISFRRIGVKDAEKIHKAMRRVYDFLEDKSLYVCDDLAYVKRHINKEGMVIAAEDNSGKIAAGLIVRYPMRAEDNLGRDIGLEEDELKTVVHMESVFVLPEYRGHKLQIKLLEYAEKLTDTGQFKIFLATVSPENTASCKSFEQSGYELYAVKEKYGGLQRRIYCKRLK
jgi:GNAT superfamily N-acetyltransferase